MSSFEPEGLEAVRASMESFQKAQPAASPCVAAVFRAGGAPGPREGAASHPAASAIVALYGADHRRGAADAVAWRATVDGILAGIAEPDREHVRWFLERSSWLALARTEPPPGLRPSLARLLDAVAGDVSKTAETIAEVGTMPGLYDYEIATAVEHLLEPLAIGTALATVDAALSAAPATAARIRIKAHRCRLLVAQARAAARSCQRTHLRTCIAAFFDLDDVGDEHVVNVFVRSAARALEELGDSVRLRAFVDECEARGSREARGHRSGDECEARGSREADEHRSGDECEARGSREAGEHRSGATYAAAVAEAAMRAGDVPRAVALLERARARIRTGPRKEHMLRAEAAVAVVETIAAIGDFAVRSEQARIAAADLAFLDDSFQTRAIFPTHQLVCAEKIVDALLAAPS